MNQLLVSLAYKYVAVSMMLAEANFCSEALHLPSNSPIQREQIRQEYVGPPRLVRSLGSIDTDQYSFGFSESGRLRFVTRLNAFGKKPMREIHLELAEKKSAIDANQAYTLATNRLVAMSVDVAALEKKFQGKVQQRFFYSNGDPSPPLKATTQKINLPIFDVTWGDPDSSNSPAIIVTIYGVTKELLQIRQNDESFSRRPARTLKNAERLLSIPDSEFLKYTPERRAELVMKFGN